MRKFALFNEQGFKIAGYLEDYPNIPADAIEITDEEESLYNNGFIRVEGVPVPAPPIEPEPPTLQEQKEYFINLVQAHLDKKCQERGYDNGFACASYATSSVPKFKQEAEAFVAWRDQVWQYCYAQLELFIAGQRDVPTDLIAELPTLEW